MGREEEQKKEEGKGFAGLSSLVSEVDTMPPPTAKAEPAAAVPGAGHPAPQPAQPHPQPRQRQTYQEPAQPSSSGSSGGKWVIGIAAVIGVLWLIGQSDKSPTSPATPYSPPAQTATPSYSPPAEPQAPSRPQESMPPVGQDLVFSTSQIRYCLAEDIRLEGAKSAVNNYIDSDVNRFNAMVADYNSRCGSFRYRGGTLEGARREIESYRSQHESEGRSRFSRSPSIDSLPAPMTSTGGWSANDPVVLDASPKTATPATAPVFVPPLPSVQGSGPPANSWVSGSSWYCNDGYKKVGNSCEKLLVPPNAWVSGSNWYCNDGFQKVENQCVALDVPDNAWVSGSNWYCNDGYRKVGDRCERLNVPRNAWVSGANWYCNDGYRKVGDACVSVFQQ